MLVTCVPALAFGALITNGAMFGGMAPGDVTPSELPDTFMALEMISDGTDLYIRAPVLAAFAEAGVESMAVFTEVGDGWGYVDGGVPGVQDALAGTMGIGSVDPSAMFEVLAAAEGVESIGAAEIRGVSTIGLRAKVDLTELMPAPGLSIAADEDVLSGVTFPTEAWIDKDGFVRRIVINLPEKTLAEAAEASGEDIPSSMFGDANISLTMDMFDYNADIVIEIPTEYIDITEEFAELVTSQNG
jgi:hypothetical protein